MPKTRQQKEKIREQLEDYFSKDNPVILVNYSNLNAESMFELRKKMKEEGCNLKVVKKNLMEKALQQLEKNSLAEELTNIKQEMALVLGNQDEVTKSKICYQFSKNNNENLEILGGIIENQFVDKSKITELAELPSREGLLAKLVGSLSAPMTKFNNVLQQNIKGLLYSLRGAGF